MMKIRTVLVIVVLLAFAINGASAATINMKLANMGDYGWTKVAVNRYDPNRIASVTEKGNWGVPPANGFSYLPEKSIP